MAAVSPPRSKTSANARNYLSDTLNRFSTNSRRPGCSKAEEDPGEATCCPEDPSEITVLDIINAAQGPIVPVACLNENKRNCEVFPECVTRHVWKETQNLLVDYFDSVTIADLLASARKQRLPRDLHHKFMYEI